jgi:hypothetical protein
MAVLRGEDPNDHEPGTHALVIGVSRYLHFDDGPEPTEIGRDFHMEQLSAAARSASEVAAWLLTEYRSTHAPLKSLRVLLSPSPDEQIAEPVATLLRPDAQDIEATLANAKTAFRDFRDVCSGNRNNVGFVYVAGHGVQLNPTGAILLLTDVGDKDAECLERALDMAGLHGGLNHPGSARTQFWFVDACRQEPWIADRYESMAGAYTFVKPKGITETSPLFLASITGGSAYERPHGETLFAEALLWALRGGAAVGPETPDDGEGVGNWHVPVSSLMVRLRARVRELAAGKGAEQDVSIAGQVGQATLQEFEQPPKVDLCIELNPEEARPLSSGTLKQGAGLVVVDGYREWPLRQSVDAGLYSLTIRAEAPYVDQDDLLLNVAPPSPMNYPVTIHG